MHLECRHRTNHTRSSRQFSRHDTRGLDGRLECATADLGAQWSEQRLASRGHAAGDDDDVGIDDVEERRDSGAEVARGVAHDLVGQSVALLGGGVHDLRGDPLQLTVHQRRQQRRRVFAHQRLARAGRDRRARRIRLETAVVAAFAQAAVDVDRRVPDLAGDVGRAVIQLPIDDDPAADPCADRDADYVAAAARRAKPPLAHGRAVRVVVECRGQAQTRRDAIAQREIAPSEIRRDDDQSLLAIQRSGRADPDPKEIFSRHPGFVDRVENHALDHSHDPVDDALRAQLRLCRDASHARGVRAVLAQRARGNLRSAEIHANDELFLSDHALSLNGENGNGGSPLSSFLSKGSPAHAPLRRAERSRACSASVPADSAAGRDDRRAGTRACRSRRRSTLARAGRIQTRARSVRKS